MANTAAQALAGTNIRVVRPVPPRLATLLLPKLTFDVALSECDPPGLDRDRHDYLHFRAGEGARNTGQSRTAQPNEEVRLSSSTAFELISELCLVQVRYRGGDCPRRPLPRFRSVLRSG